MTYTLINIGNRLTGSTIINLWRAMPKFFSEKYNHENIILILFCFLTTQFSIAQNPNQFYRKQILFMQQKILKVLRLPTMKE